MPTEPGTRKQGYRSSIIFIILAFLATNAAFCGSVGGEPIATEKFTPTGPAVYRGDAVIRSYNDNCQHNSDATLTVKDKISLVVSTMVYADRHCDNSTNMLEIRISGDYSSENKNIVFTSCNGTWPARGTGEINGMGFKGIVYCENTPEGEMKVDFSVQR